MSRYRNTAITLIIIAAFVGFLVWSTIRAQVVECQVCVRYNGMENCAVASGASEEEAARTAQTTACGPLVRGMNDAIACDNTPPIVRRCRRN
jgi:hypothetical protein